ncbi:MAG: hypothetical protein WCI27_06635 [Candidatus Omnitrophota bacterium]
MFSIRWAVFIGALFCMAPLFISGKMQTKEYIELIVIAVLSGLASLQFKTYYVFGGTEESTNAALTHALMKLNIKHEDVSGSYKLSEGGIISSSFGGWGTAGVCVVRVLGLRNKGLLRNFASEVNLYFQMNPVVMSKYPAHVSNLVVLGVAAAALSFGVLVFLSTFVISFFGH